MKKFIEKKLKENKKLTVQVIGDSIVWGETHCTAEQTFCAELARLFAKEFYGCSVYRYDGIVKSEKQPLSGFSEKITVQRGNEGDIIIIRNGVGGNTVRRALNRKEDFSHKSVEGKATDIFLTMFGINDSLRQDADKFVTPEVFYKNYAELYDVLKGINNNAEIILMTPSYNDGGDSRVGRLDRYADEVKALAEEKKCGLIDVHALWMEHMVIDAPNHGQADWLSGRVSDSCHFSPKGSRETAKYIFDELLKQNY